MEALDELIFQNRYDKQSGLDINYKHSENAQLTKQNMRIFKRITSNIEYYFDYYQMKWVFIGVNDNIHQYSNPNQQEEEEQEEEQIVITLLTKKQKQEKINRVYK